MCGGSCWSASRVGLQRWAEPNDRVGWQLKCWGDTANSRCSRLFTKFIFVPGGESWVCNVL